ncbi:MAG: CHASE4 domain-containing protein [Limnospira sp.]
MKLHKKTLLIIGVALISLIVVLYTTASFILIHNFHHLETESVHQDVVRAIKALEDDLTNLDSIAQDHAKWDDTYAFIDRHDSHYVRSNLVNTTFIDLKLNLFTLVDAGGQIVFSKGFDLDLEAEVPVPASLSEHLRSGRLLFSEKTPSCSHDGEAVPCPAVGILMLPEGPLLLSVRPILTSVAKGPSRGILLVGRYLDDKEIDRLAQITQLSLQIDPIVPEDPGGGGRMSDTDAITVRPLNASAIVGEAPIPDIYDQPALRLRVRGDRPIYRQGRSSLIYLTISLFIVGILLSGITLLVFEKLILTRLLALTHRVNQIGKSRDLSMRVSVPEGEDELSDLGNTINEMLEALERANVQSRDSEERYRLMAEHSTDLITRHSRRGTIRYASPACYTLLGYEPEELIGRHPSQFLHPDDVEALANTYDIVLTQNVSCTLTYRIRHQNGEYIWFETTSRAIYDPDTGIVQEILGVSRDISDRKQREQELQESEASIRSLYQITSARNLEWQEQLRQILELGSQKFGLEVGLLARIQNLEEPAPESEIQAILIPDEDPCPEQVFELKNNAFCMATARAGKPLIFESVLVSGLAKSAGECEFQIEAYMGIPVQVDGATYGTLCFWSRDPLSEPFRAVDRELLKLMAQWVGTELERQQTARDLSQARDEALAATRAKSEFLATMSHEIRTPMNAVIGMTGLLLDTPLSPIQQDFVETIRSSSDALLSLINDILDFSKIESGKLDLETFPFSLRTCIEESIDLLVTKAAGKNLELGYLIDPSTPHQVVGDMARVRQILVNLLSNAVKFTASGDVLVSAKATPLTPERYEIQLSVKDTGIGIPPEGMGRLFKSFSQVDASTNRQYGGTGLGLAISKRLAEMMGGRMWVTSHNAIGGDPPEHWEFAGDPSVGSTFYFSIIVESGLNVLPEWSHTSELTGKRLLVLCTHPTSRRILTANVRAWGLAVEAAETPTEALEWLEAGQGFDAAIVEMPTDGGDGLDVVRQIRRSPAGRQLPLVMLTSVGRQNLNGSEFGEFVAFLSKPIKQSPLYNILANVLCGEPLKTKQWSESQMRSPQDIPLLAEQLPLRILLAEDHLVNQKVALQILQRMGYRADVAGNGLEVLEALQRQPYDVILMDMQMPIMDGLEAARQIQKRYGGSEKARARRPRIIAVTANARSSDRTECMEAGMDDYISKPIRMERLVKVLGKCRPVVSDLDLGTTATPPQAQADGEMPAPADGGDNGQLPPILDPAVIRGLREIEALEEVVEMYLESAPQLLQTIDEALSLADAAALKQAAHSLKSTSGTLGAFGLSELCLELEMIGRRGVDAGTPIPEAEAREIYTRVEVELKRVRSAMQLEARQNQSRESGGSHK